jgi:hypothetical protein
MAKPSADNVALLRRRRGTFTDAALLDGDRLRTAKVGTRTISHAA